jgi:hypothetical protein
VVVVWVLVGLVWTVIVTGAVVIRVLVGVGLYRSASQAGLGRRAATTVAVGAVIVLAGWVAVSAVLAYHGAYRSGPWVLVAFVSILLALLASTRIPAVARTLTAPRAVVDLALPQAVRVVGGVFLLMMLLGRVPALFAVPAGLGDVATGLAAPWVARALSRGTGRRKAIWFNALGIVDIVVALSLGALVNLVGTGSSGSALGVLPLVLIPTTALPLTATMHIVSLRRLTITSSSSDRVGRVGPVASLSE